ncbi:MAG: subfamily polymerase sigma-24 factor [Acidimicrobiales bacterium]|nr:subfamily polymerase sigma-24 factor [Acidimicrobiales bacterium]
MAFTEIDEKALVQAYQAGNERAFDTIVRTQYNALYAHALRRLFQHEAAEDAVQDTLLRAYRALPNLDGDLALKAWLHRILTNVCYDEGNRRRRQHGLVEKIGALPEELGEDPVDEAVLHDTVRVMSEALQDLPDSYREALVLRYVDGLSFREVAEASGISEENARARVQRGKSALHKIMTRLAVMAAFLIPGLRRAQEARASADATAAAAAPSEQAVNLATQLTSHVVQAAPTVSRLAEAASAFPGGKSALAATAMAAVAAVSVPIAATTVGQQSHSQRPPAVAAAPATTSRSSASSAPTVTIDPSTTTTLVTTTTTTTVPPSLATPFQGLGKGTKVLPGADPTTTTTSTTVPPAPVVRPDADADFDGQTLQVDGAAPQFDVSGGVKLTAKSHSATGKITGRLFMNGDGTATSDDLTFSFGTDKLVLRFSGTVTASSDEAGTSYLVDGIYSLVGGDRFGLRDRGAITVSFHPAGSSSTLRLSLRPGS